MKKPRWAHVALAALGGMILGLALQWLAFEKELWWWGIRREQRAIKIRIERIERVDLQKLLDTLERHGQEIEKTLRALGYQEKEE